MFACNECVFQRAGLPNMILLKEVLLQYMTSMRVRKHTMWKEVVDVTILQLYSHGFYTKFLMDPLPIKATIPWSKPPPGLEALGWDHIRVPVFMWACCLGLSFCVMILENVRPRRSMNKMQI